MKKKKRRNIADDLINRIEEGSLKSVQEWANFYYPNISQIRARQRLQSLISAVKRRKRKQVYFLAPNDTGHLTIQTIDELNGNSFKRQSKNAASAMKNFFRVSDETMVEQPNRKSEIMGLVGQALIHTGVGVLGQQKVKLLLENKDEKN